MTRILSLEIIVWSLWAIVRTVHSLNSSLIKVWIFYSVTKSILAVASSRMTTLFFRKTALQMQIKDFSPEERLSPLSEIFKPNRSESERWSRPAFLRSCSISSSEHLPSGSMLNLKVPVNKDGSYGMMVTFLLSCSSEISLMFSPSISIEPPQISTILVKKTKSWLSSASPSNDSNLLSSTNFDWESLEHLLSVWSIP